MITQRSSRPSEHRPPSRRGILMLDVVSGLLLMLVTLALLGSVVSRSHIVARRLADDRAAVRLAEATLLALDTNAAAPTDERVIVTPLDTSAPAGHRWIRVTVTINNRHADVIGLIPSTATANEATR